MYSSDLSSIGGPSGILPGGCTAAANDLVHLGGGKFRTRDFDIEVKQGEILVTDRATGKSIRCHGDPHLWTGDGDRLQFHKDNLTLDLADGTKITLKPTAPDAGGVALLDQIALMTEGGAALLQGVSTPGGPGEPILSEDSQAIDDLMADGTVLHQRGEADDLFAGERELVGGDPTAPFGEIPLDGLGGNSQLRFDRPIPRLTAGDIRDLDPQALASMDPRQLVQLLMRLFELMQTGGGQDPSARLPGSEPPLVWAGGSPTFDETTGMQSPWDAGQRLDPFQRGYLGGGVGDFGGLGRQLEPHLERLLPGGADLVGAIEGRLGNQLGGTGGAMGGFMNRLGEIDGNIQALRSAALAPGLPENVRQMVQFQLQELIQQKRELVEMMTSILKADHESRMAIIRNFAA